MSSRKTVYTTLYFLLVAFFVYQGDWLSVGIMLGPLVFVLLARENREIRTFDFPEIFEIMFKFSILFLFVVPIILAFILGAVFVFQLK